MQGKKKVRSTDNHKTHLFGWQFYRGYANKCRDHRMSEHAQVAENVEALEIRLAELERRKEELIAELGRIEEEVRRRDEEERQWREALEEFADYIEEGELERLGLADSH